MPHQEVALRRADKRLPPRRQFVQGARITVDIGPAVEQLILDLLGTHEAWRSLWPLLLEKPGEETGLHLDADSEVDDFRVAEGIDKNIIGLHVAGVRGHRTAQ